MRKLLVKHEKNPGPVLVAVIASGASRAVTLVMNAPSADPGEELFRLVMSIEETRELANDLFSAADALDLGRRGH